MDSCSLRGTVTRNGTPTAATIYATPLLPGPDPSGGSYALPTAKTITVPSTGVIPSSPALDVPGDPGTWPTDGSLYRITVSGGPDSTDYAALFYVSAGTTELDLGVIDLDGVDSLPPTLLHRVVHDGASYPARPAGVAGGLVDYVGPTEPLTWLDGDTWTQTA